MKTKSNLILIKILIDIYCDSSIHSHSQSPSTKGTPFLHQKMEAIGFQHYCTFVSVPNRSISILNPQVPKTPRFFIRKWKQLDSNTIVHLY